jgi:hypothetical protein
MAKGAKPKGGQSNSQVVKTGSGKLAAVPAKPRAGSSGVTSKPQKR